MLSRVMDARPNVRARLDARATGCATLSLPRPSARSRPTDLMPKKCRDVRAALLAVGWQVVRQRGSHEVGAHPDRDERIVVAGKSSDTVPIGTLDSIRKASGWENLR